MNLKIDEIPIDEVVVNAHVQFSKMFWFRLRFGTLLLRLLSIVWDCEIKIEEGSEWSHS